MTEDLIAYYNAVITKRVTELNQLSTPLEERNTYGKAFIQLMNLWREDAAIEQFVFSKRIASIAAGLMKVEGVRLYHEQALFRVHPN